MGKKTDPEEVLNQAIIIRVSRKLLSQLHLLQQDSGSGSIGQVCRQLLNEHPRIIALADHLPVQHTFPGPSPYCDTRKSKAQPLTGSLLHMAQMESRKRIRRGINEILSRFSELTIYRFSLELKVQGIETRVKKDRSGKLAGIAFIDSSNGLKHVGSDLGSAYSGSTGTETIPPDTQIRFCHPAAQTACQTLEKEISKSIKTSHVTRLQPLSSPFHKTRWNRLPPIPANKKRPKSGPDTPVRLSSPASFLQRRYVCGAVPVH